MSSAQEVVFPPLFAKRLQGDLFRSTMQLRALQQRVQGLEGMLDGIKVSFPEILREPVIKPFAFGG